MILLGFGVCCQYTNEIGWPIFPKQEAGVYY